MQIKSAKSAFFCRILSGVMDKAFLRSGILSRIMDKAFLRSGIISRIMDKAFFEERDNIPHNGQSLLGAKLFRGQNLKGAKPI